MSNIFTQSEFNHYMETNFTWSPFFKITNLCNYNCAHCCERSGPTAAASFIPLSDVRTIIEQFRYTKNVMPVACISGGEPTTVYKHAPYYIPQILKTLARAGFAIEFKTNAGWTLTNDAPIIFRDMEQFFTKFPKTLFAYHLSLDKFHPHAEKTTIEFIQWFYNNKKIPANAVVHLFYDDATTVADMFTNLAEKSNIFLDLNHQSTGVFAKIKANKFDGREKYITIEPYHGISNRGRASDNKIATQNNKSVLEHFSNLGNTHGMAFDNNGMAYFDCAADMAYTPYKNDRGQIKSINQIKRELFGILYQKYITEQQMK